MSIKLIPPSIPKKYFIIPINRVGPKLTLAMADPSNIVVIDEIKFMTGFNVEPVVASETEIIDAIKKYYGGGGSVADWGRRLFRPRLLPGRGKLSSPDGDLMVDEDTVDVDEFDKLVHGAVDNVEVVEAPEQRTRGMRSEARSSRSSMAS